MEDENPLLLERLRAAVFANASHGFGHVFLWFMGSAGSEVELSLRPEAVANLLVLLAFWVGTLRLVVAASTRNAAYISILVLAAQYQLRVWVREISH